MATNAFIRTQTSGVTYYAVSFLEQTGLVRAAFSTRLGGVSTGETATMNFSTKRADSVENVRENYRMLCRAAGFDATKLAVSRQVHGIILHEPTDDVGHGVFDDWESPVADGLMTDRPGVVLVKHSADCVPVYLLDTRHRAIALVHAGWRGTHGRIAQAALRAMAARFGTRPEDCLGAIGPSIGPCCFLVGNDVAAQFEAEFPGWELVDYSGAQPAVDLWACNARQLTEAGVPAGNIAVADLCTACDTGTFYSHRAEKGRCGSMVAMMSLL